MKRRALVFIFLAVAATAAAQTPGPTQDYPVARVTIYPGDVISEAMLGDRAYTPPPGAESHYARARDALLGKVARRTLLPGQLIPVASVDNPRIVTVGAQIKIVFSEGGLEIVAYGVAQQSGGLGDLIRVRNQDSGLFVSGRVQADGSVLIDG